MRSLYLSLFGLLALNSCSPKKVPPVKMDVYFTPEFNKEKGDQAFVCGWTAIDGAMYCFDLREFLTELDRRKAAEGRESL